jgi:hypothetical protein
VGRLTDADRLAAYLDAINNWVVEGCVSFDRLSKEGAKYLRELGVKQRELKELMYEYVAGGGEIDEVREKSKDSEFDFHYDLRIKFQGKRVYIETRMDPDYPRTPLESLESTIYVVNVHDE